jgi:hypothetical protein
LATQCHLLCEAKPLLPARKKKLDKSKELVYVCDG